jgi:hypothetical protein
MTMNKAVVRKMIKRLESVPEHYDQEAYYVERNDKAPCGTVACLAGEAVICSAKTVKAGIESAFAEYGSIPERAEMILGLHHLQHSVFASDGGGWPQPYRTQFAQSQKADQSKIAVAYLKEALKRGTMIW